MTTRCNLITGFLGAGKTTLIRHLLSGRPANERWAVIVNEFGIVGIDGTALAAAQSGSTTVELREVAGGCICCSANVPLRVAITDVLRRVRPDRLLLEPSGLGHPAAILATLAEPGLAKALSVGAVVCVADPRHPLPGSGHADPLDDTWCDQLAMADVIVANKRDLVDDERYRAFAAWVESLYPPKQAIVPAVEGQVPASLLDMSRARWRPILAGSHAAGTTHAREPACGLPGLGTRHAALSGTTASVGWLFDDPCSERAAFDAERIDHLMISLAGIVSASSARLLRAKGALRTDHGTRLVEWSAAQIRSSPLVFTGPARFELLFEASEENMKTATSAIASAVETVLRAALAVTSAR